MSHLNANTLWDYAHASLDGDDVAQVAAHLTRCASCQAQVAEIDTTPVKRLAPDGEVWGTTPVKLTCLRHRLEVFA